MMYEEWIAEFSKGKSLVAEFSQSEKFAVHTMQRFAEGEKLWDVALTYTNRLVTRIGTIGQDGTTIEWSEWQTVHDVVYKTY